VSPVAVLPIADLPTLGHHHVRVIIVDAAGRLLLLLRTDHPQWEPVQGTIGDADAPSPDETPRHAAERELEEETGYGGASLTWRKLYERCWTVTLPGGAGDPTISNEHTAWRWFSPSAAAAWLAREQLYGQVIDRARRTPADYGPPPRRPLPDDEHAALHEATHATFAAIMGVPIRTVTIEPNADDRGHVEFEDATPRAALLVAGLAAPVLSRLIGGDGSEGRGDWEIATMMAGDLAKPGQGDALLAATASGVREWIYNDPELQEQIAAVAAALLERRSLSGAEVEQIVADVLAGVRP
jgi:8-oxo-dGTP pyrophosphatase MutT (NUDIX family)